LVGFFWDKLFWKYKVYKKRKRKKYLKRGDKKLRTLYRRRPFYDMDKSWLSFVPQHLLRYPENRARYYQNRPEHYFRASIDYSFNFNNRRHAISALKKYPLKIKSFFFRDFVNKASVRRNAINLNRINNGIFFDILSLDKDSVVDRVHMKDYSKYVNLLNDEFFLGNYMKFKYPLNYDYINNLDPVVSYVSLKDYEWLKIPELLQLRHGRKKRLRRKLRVFRGNTRKYLKRVYSVKPNEK